MPNTPSSPSLYGGGRKRYYLFACKRNSMPTNEAHFERIVRSFSNFSHGQTLHFRSLAAEKLASNDPPLQDSGGRSKII